MKYFFLIIVYSIFIQTLLAQNNKIEKESNNSFCSFNKLIKSIKLLHFNNVVFYNFNCVQSKKNLFEYNLVNQNKVINLNASNKRVLNLKERKKLLSVLILKKNYFSSLPESKGCYNPKMGFVFYDSTKTIIAHFDICLECNQILFKNFNTGFVCQTDFYEFGKKNFKQLSKYYMSLCN